jgi:proteasome lid subunit RPN8/RPN11
MISKDGDGDSVEVYRMENVAVHPSGLYVMDPAAQLAVMLGIEEAGLELGAIYHSHPMIRAYPSSIDVSLAYYPDTDYIIVGLTREPIEVRSFRIVDEEVEEVTAYDELLQIVRSSSRKSYWWRGEDDQRWARGGRRWLQGSRFS